MPLNGLLAQLQSWSFFFLIMVLTDEMLTENSRIVVKMLLSTKVFFYCQWLYVVKHKNKNLLILVWNSERSSTCTLLNCHKCFNITFHIFTYQQMNPPGKIIRQPQNRYSDDKNFALITSEECYAQELQYCWSKSTIFCNNDHSKARLEWWALHAVGRKPCQMGFVVYT